MIELDPSLIKPIDNHLDATLSTINIFGEEYKVDSETFEKLMKFEADEQKFFVKAKNRKEKKFFHKKKIYQFGDWFILWKADLDKFYRSL